MSENMEIVEITENCFNFIASLKGHYLRDGCVFDFDNNLVAFIRHYDTACKYFGIIFREVKNV